MEKLLLLATLLTSTAVMGQNAVVPAGGNGTGAGSFSFTVGQIFFKPVSDNITFIIEGVQQPPSGNVLPVTLLYFRVQPKQSPNRQSLPGQPQPKATAISLPLSARPMHTRSRLLKNIRQKGTQLRFRHI